MAVAPLRVVALRALGLGDLLTVVPALRALRRAHPAHRLVLAAPATLAPLVRAARLADEVVDTDLRAEGGSAPHRPLDGALHGARLAVNLHGRGPQSTRLLLDTGPQELLAFPSAENAVPGPTAPAWRSDEHEVSRWCRLLEAAGIPTDPTELAIEVDAAPPPAAEGALLLHPGAASPARRWPEERWVAVARAAGAAGRRVVLTGGPGEAALAHRIAEAAGLDDDAVLAGRTDLVALAAAVAAAGAIVCGDTGVAHLATATGTPSVVLFGPVPPSRWGPPAERTQHRALWAGRQGDPHADALDPGLAALQIDDVLAALDDLTTTIPSPAPH